MQTDPEKKELEKAGANSTQNIPADDLISKLISASKDPHKTLSIEVAREILEETRRFIKEKFVEEVDYRMVGKGKNRRASILKPGGEKLALKFLLRPEFNLTHREMDWDRRIFYFEFMCKLIHIPSGLEMAQYVASCNSREENYQYQWVFKKDIPQGMEADKLVKKQKESKDHQTYFVYRLENPNVEDQINTFVQMAQKRCFLGAVKIATQTSDEFAEGGEANGRGLGSQKAEGAKPSLPKPVGGTPIIPKVTKPGELPQISLTTKMAILLALDHAVLNEEEKGRIQAKLDMGDHRTVTEKDLFTEAEGQRTLKYIALRERVAKVRNAVYGHFIGDEQAVDDFGRQVLNLSKMDIDKLTDGQLDKLMNAVQEEQKKKLPAENGEPKKGERIR